MKLTYDPQYNIAYIQLRAQSGRVKTVAVSDERNVDLASNGTIYRIELLNANAQLSMGRDLVLENVTTGRTRKLSLAS